MKRCPCGARINGKRQKKREVCGRCYRQAFAVEGALGRSWHLEWVSLDAAVRRIPGSEAKITLRGRDQHGNETEETLTVDGVSDFVIERKKHA